MTELVDRFEQDHLGTRVALNLAGSQQLALQIEYGAEVDLFVSADPTHVQRLHRAGLLQLPVPFAFNSLAALAAVGSDIETLSDLAEPGHRIVLAGAHVPVGHYAQRVMESLGHLEGYPPDFPEAVRGNVVSEEESVDGVLGKLMLGEADAVMVYRSDLTRVPAKVYRQLEIPTMANVTATYTVALGTRLSDPDLAADFLSFLTSEPALEVLQRHGFRTPDRP